MPRALLSALRLQQCFPGWVVGLKSWIISDSGLPTPRGLRHRRVPLGSMIRVDTRHTHRPNNFRELGLTSI
ncbi:hypothetical protein BKA83DRAFT_573042 [Pisolithus microcarpus]|nr:hypothetical protein BKA83DRAFT_573042 [Pisolithus microcarpus]